MKKSSGIVAIGLGIMGCSHSIKTGAISEQFPNDY